MVASILEMLLICRPISAQWDNSSRCGNQKLSFLIVESVGIALDAMLLVTPIYSVSRLCMDTRAKIKVIVGLEIGSLYV